MGQKYGTLAEHSVHLCDHNDTKYSPRYKHFFRPREAVHLRELLGRWGGLGVDPTVRIPIDKLVGSRDHG
jgi:hypothetical protein